MLSPNIRNGHTAGRAVCPFSPIGREKEGLFLHHRVTTHMDGIVAYQDEEGINIMIYHGI